METALVTYTETLLARSSPGSYVKLSIFSTQTREPCAHRTSKTLYFLTQRGSQTVFSGDKVTVMEQEVEKKDPWVHAQCRVEESRAKPSHGD